MYSFYMVLKMYVTNQSHTLESLRLFGCYKVWLQLMYAIGKSTKDDGGGGGGDNDDDDGWRGSQNQMKVRPRIGHGKNWATTQFV